MSDYIDLIPVIVEREQAILPDGFDSWGVKSVRPDLRTHGGYLWTLPGGVAECDPELIVASNSGARPRSEGDGLCVATSWRGMASGSIPAATLLLVAYSSADILGRDDRDGKLRCCRVAVVALVDGHRLLREVGSGANLGGAYLGGANLSGAYLSRANLSWADLSRANLSWANLGGADLGGANLSGAYLSRANLSWADLSGANLSGADLSGANLGRANLGRADLSWANLSWANLGGADLGGADLSGANLSGADLSGADLSGANLGGAKTDTYTILPEGFDRGRLA